MLNKIKIPIAVGYTILLTILSLISAPNMPGLGTDYDDKLYHFLAYFLLTAIWYLAIGAKINKNQIWQLALYCTVFGIIIEAIQGKLTVNRVGDLLDIIANIIGVVIATILIIRRQKQLS